MKVEFYHALAAWTILKLCERKFKDHSMTIVNWELRTRFQQIIWIRKILCLKSFECLQNLKFHQGITQ